MVKNAAPNSPEPQGFWKSRKPSPIRESHSRACRRANNRPAATVAKVQRRAADLFPDFAPRIAINIVKLLVMRMKVISMTFTTLGKNLKGAGQSGVALRRYP